MNATDLQNLIITSLAEADPSALGVLQSNVPLYWQVHARAFPVELQYWYARRDGIQLLQASLNRQIDYLRRTMNSSRAGFSNSRQDSSLSASSSDDSSAYSNRQSNAQYDDATDSSGSGSSLAQRNGAQAAQDDYNYTDAGQGSSSSSRTSTLTASTTIDDLQTDQNNWSQSSSRGVSSNKSDNSMQAQIGEAIGASLLGFSVAEAVTGTATQRNNAYSMLDQATNQRNTTYTMSLSQSHQAQSSQPSSQSAQSSFTADIAYTDVATSSSSMNGSSSSSYQFALSGEGAGTMTASSNGASQLSASATRTAHADGEAHSGLSAAMQNNSTMERLHQRFLHLQTLWEKCTAMIEWWEKQRLGVAPYILQEMTLQYPEGCGADIANAFLVEKPTQPVRVMGVVW